MALEADECHRAPRWFAALPAGSEARRRTYIAPCIGAIGRTAWDETHRCSRLPKPTKSNA
jgi:hypothetical protein